MRDHIAAERVPDPDCVANSERIRPRCKNLRVMFWSNRRSISTLTEAGKIGCDRRPASMKERSRKSIEVRARHTETMNENDIAGGSGLAVGDAADAYDTPREGINVHGGTRGAPH